MLWLGGVEGTRRVEPLGWSDPCIRLVDDLAGLTSPSWKGSSPSRLTADKEVKMAELSVLEGTVRETFEI